MEFNQNHKTIISSFLLLLISTALVACNGGSTTNNSYYSNDSCSLPTFNEATGQKLLSSWNDGLQMYNANTYGYSGVESSAAYFTMSYYAPDAVLLPTVSYVQRSGTQEIYNYFTHFLLKNPQMSLPQPDSIVFAPLGCGYGGADGYYDFRITDPDTLVESTVHARFTFIYKYESQSFAESVNIEAGSMAGQTVTQTNLPGWYVYVQQSSMLPEKP